MAACANVGENLTRLASLDAAIARGLDDAESGRVRPSSKVFDRLEAKLARTANRKPTLKGLGA